MKLFRLILSAAVIGGLTFSCSNEIELYPNDAPEMLFVVGSLDGTGALHQVKVRKLISGNLDASLMINDPEYYLPDNTIRVFLEDPGGREHELEPVLHGPQTGGAFRQDSNIVYELGRFTPVPGQTYTLKIEDPATGKTVSSKSTALAPAFITYPTQESTVNGKFRFTDSNRPFHISFTGARASIWTISLKYVDFMLDGDYHCRKANYYGPPAYGVHIPISQSFPLDYLWKIFNISIPDDPDVDYRQFYRFDFFIWTGDSALSSYLQVADRFTDNRRQYFNNIDGGEGLFFATSHNSLYDVSPQENFHSYLAINDSVKHLKFSRYPYAGVFTDPDTTLFNPFISTLR